MNSLLKLSREYTKEMYTNKGKNKDLIKQMESNLRSKIGDLGRIKKNRPALTIIKQLLNSISNSHK